MSGFEMNDAELDAYKRYGELLCLFDLGLGLPEACRIRSTRRTDL